MLIKNLFVVSLLAGLIAGCSSGAFTGDGGSAGVGGIKKCISTPQKPCQSTPDPGPVPGPNPDQIMTDGGGNVQITPQSCSVNTISLIDNMNGGKALCPAGSAAYAADDVTRGAPSYGRSISCCPLPASDILSKDPAVERGGDCLENEVIVGVYGGGVICGKINSNRYSLDVSAPTCYYGSGQAGGAGAAKCQIPPETLQAMLKSYGSDSCVPSPFGGLLRYIRAKTCASMGASVLKFSDTGQPVLMFK